MEQQHVSVILLQLAPYSQAVLHFAKGSLRQLISLAILPVHQLKLRVVADPRPAQIVFSGLLLSQQQLMPNVIPACQVALRVLIQGKEHNV